MRSASGQRFARWSRSWLGARRRIMRNPSGSGEGCKPAVALWTPAKGGALGTHPLIGGTGGGPGRAGPPPAPPIKMDGVHRLCMDGVHRLCVWRGRAAKPPGGFQGSALTLLPSPDRLGPRPRAGKKMAALLAPPSLGRKRPRKQTARQSRIAAVHNVASPRGWCKRFFAMQHCSRQMLRD